MSARPLALLGGNFDPVHHGHLRMALEAAQAFDADLAMLPSGTPPHRGAPHASAAQRVEMLRLALAGQTRIRCDARESGRSGPGYSVDTLRELRAEVGAERPLVLLVGLDQFTVLDTWHDWQALFAIAHVGILFRAGAFAPPSAAVTEFVDGRWTEHASDLATSPAGLAIRLDTTALDISSTRIRSDLAAGRSPRWLMPDAVLDYIRVQGLYGRKALPCAAGGPA